jgi:hypothetical protein
MCNDPDNPNVLVDCEDICVNLLSIFLDHVNEAECYEMVL